MRITAQELTPEKNIGFHIKQTLSRTIMSVIWLCIPFVLIFDVPEKITVCVFIITGFTFFSHCSLTYIFKDLVESDKKLSGYLLLLIFGPIQSDRLLKFQKTQEQAAS